MLYYVCKEYKVRYIVLILLTTVLGAQYLNDYAKEVTIDTTTALIWQDNNLTEIGLNWYEALEQCDSLEIGGYSDYRVPNYNELLSIINLENNPFNYYAKKLGYWTSTTDASDANKSWILKSMYCKEYDEEIGYCNEYSNIISTTETKEYKCQLGVARCEDSCELEATNGEQRCDTGAAGNECFADVLALKQSCLSRCTCEYYTNSVRCVRN